MKIVGFTQHRNELSNGNLHNWLRCMEMCEYIYVFDQGSDDGSLEILREHPKVVLIENPTNDFKNENICKGRLLRKLLNEQPDTDWIFWADVDYLLDGRFLENDYEKFFKMCKMADKAKVDGIAFGHYNLWRSDTYYRVDSMYHASHEPGRISLWKNNGRLEMNETEGLHKSPIPLGIDNTIRVDCNLIHRGFATDYQVINKYKLYRSFGQRGWELNRLVDEKTLVVERLADALLPSWLELTDDVDPRNKNKLIDMYDLS